MLRRAVTFMTVAIAGMVLFTNTVLASPLEDAVSDYNSAASGLKPLWDAYCSDHEAAFDDYVSMMTNYYNYLVNIGSDQEANYFACYQDDQSSLVNTSGPALNSSFEAFLTALSDAAQLLDDVLTLDEASQTEVAYTTGNTLFSLPEQPFPFWDDPSWPDISAWQEFTFPELAVGSTGNYVAYTGNGLDDLEVFLQSATDPESWLTFGEWLLEHYNDADEINAVRAGDWDVLCLYCAETVDMYRVIYYNWLDQRGYSDEDIANFCQTYGPDGNDLCSDITEARNKATFLGQLVRSNVLEDMQKVVDAIHDYINDAYWPDIPFCPPPE